MRSVRCRHYEVGLEVERDAYSRLSLRETILQLWGIACTSDTFACCLYISACLIQHFEPQDHLR